jgi:hypothetical protein
MAGLLLACAAGPRELRDEGSERIEEAMRPEARPERIPEGIALGLDAPPLAPPEPEVARSPEPVVSGDELLVAPWLHGSGVVVIPGPACAPGLACGPRPGTVRYHVEPRPGGSIPGLLP